MDGVDLSQDLVEAAIAGHPEAQDQLVRGLTPHVQKSVGAMLRRWHTGPAAARDLRQELEDLVQEALLELFESDAQVLRRWNPDRLPLGAYAGYIAKIRTAEVLRSRRSPWREEPRPLDTFDRPSSSHSPEEAAGSRDFLRKIYLCLVSRFKVADFQLFELLFVRQTSPPEAAEASGKSTDAVYQWRSRLYKRARECGKKVSK